MNIYDACEQAYKNGYSNGYEAGKPKWIPVTERLPKKEEYVLLWYAKNNRNPTLHAKNPAAVGRLTHGMFIVDGCSVEVTHWMPLPEPPKVE